MESYFLDQEENHEEESLDFGRYLRALKRKWWLVILIALAVTGPWVYYLQQQPPIYEATALIRFKSFAQSAWSHNLACLYGCSPPESSV